MSHQILFAVVSKPVVIGSQQPKRLFKIVTGKVLSFKVDDAWADLIKGEHADYFCVISFGINL